MIMNLPQSKARTSKKQKPLNWRPQIAPPPPVRTQKPRLEGASAAKLAALKITVSALNKDWLAQTIVNVLVVATRSLSFSGALLKKLLSAVARKATA